MIKCASALKSCERDCTRSSTDRIEDCGSLDPSSILGGCKEMELTMKKATLADIPTIVEIYSQWQDFQGILPEKLIALETEEDLLTFVEDQTKKRLYLVAETEAKKIVGVCYLDLSFDSLDVVRLGSFIIDKQHRHSGVGTQMMKFILDYCRSLTITKVWLWTQEELSDAIRFYEKMGFH